MAPNKAWTDSAINGNPSRVIRQTLSFFFFFILFFFFLQIRLWLIAGQNGCHKGTKSGQIRTSNNNTQLTRIDATKRTSGQKFFFLTSDANRFCLFPFFFFKKTNKAATDSLEDSNGQTLRKNTRISRQQKERKRLNKKQG